MSSGSRKQGHQSNPSHAQGDEACGCHRCVEPRNQPRARGGYPGAFGASQRTLAEDAKRGAGSARGTTPRDQTPNINRRKNLLSFDAGFHTLAYSSLLILKTLQAQFGNLSPTESHLLPYQNFDMMAGSGTGGLFAIMLGRLRMNVMQCMDEYEKVLRHVFPHGGDGPPAGVNLRDWTASNSHAMEGALKAMLRRLRVPEDTLFIEGGDAPCKVFVPIMNQRTSHQVLLTSYDAVRSSSSMFRKVKIWEAALATTADPRYFEPCRIRIQDRYDWIAISGIMRAPNPIRELWVEAQMEFELRESTYSSDSINPLSESSSEDAEHALGVLVSIGQGIRYLKRFRMSGREYANSLFDLVSDTEHIADTFIYEHSYLDGQERGNGHRGRRQRYYRFNVERGLEDTKDLDYSLLGYIASWSEHYVCLHPANKMVHEVIQCFRNRPKRRMHAQISRNPT